jgi:nickel-dependent lactate racemase
VYGMEKMMGRADTPVRRLLGAALERFCADLPIVFVLTVVGRARHDEPGDSRGLVTRGLYIGKGTDCFEMAARLSAEVNFHHLDRPLHKVVVYMDPEEFHSTWLANKAIYRTRMAIADNGELIILAPGVRRFGEDPEIDALIRKYGYRNTPEILRLVDGERELSDNLSAAAHLIHGSSEGRFRITYCPGALGRAEMEGVGYGYAELGTMLERYDPSSLRDGWNEANGEQVYFIPQPALGLWASGRRGP